MMRFRRIAVGAAGILSAAGAALIVKHYFFVDRHAQRTEAHVQIAQRNINRRVKDALPTRREQIGRLKNESFDVLVIGGGATGSGCALDATTRGLKTALVELDDFSSGTSSRSTKLIHGGVRYLEKAVFNLDLEQYFMVKEALHERGNLLAIAPHLSFPLPIMLPVYSLWQLPYFWLGIKAYDIVSGKDCLKGSYVLSKERALEQFPMLKRDKLKGALVYYDGSHNDSRMCLSIAVTAARLGAAICNHVRVTGLVKDDDGRIAGATMHDEQTGESWTTRCKCVVNATGPFTDSIRKMDSPGAKDIMRPSSGLHIVLPNYYSPERMGLLDPATSDGRVIFLLPWQDSTIAGTTDSPCEVTHAPAPDEDGINFILGEVKDYLSPDLDVRRADVMSAWVGIRPLVMDPNKEDTQSLVRNHVVHVSPDSGLVTIAGGKWTTYRSMAEETISAAVEHCSGLGAVAEGESKTDGLLLEGAHGWTPTMYIKLVQDLGVDVTVAQHLSETYGDRAFEVGRMAAATGIRWPVVGRRLHQEYPYIEAEVRYAVKREYACTAVDVVARRTRLAFLNVRAAEEALPRIVDIMAEELGWSKEEKARQAEEAVGFLVTQMGKAVNCASRHDQPVNLLQSEIRAYADVFNKLDYDKKGFVTINDLRKSLKDRNLNVSGEELSAIVKEIDTNQNGQVEMDEYLQLMSAIKHGKVANSRFANLAEEHAKSSSRLCVDNVDRSCGGV